MTDREFMGISVEGSIHRRSRHIYEQEPIENLYPYFKQAFADGVKAIAWEQYTPYFNDGEPCEFGIGEPRYTSNKKLAEKWLNEERGYLDGEEVREVYPDQTEEWYKENYYLEPWSYEGYGDHPDGLENVNIPVDEGRFEHALLGAFGDHTTVVVTPDRVVQFEYEHD